MGSVPCSGHQTPQARRAHLLRTRSGKHYDIEPLETFRVVAETLADLALQPMAHHGTTRDAPGNGKPKPGMMYFVWPHNDRHDLHVQPDPTGKDPREVFPSPQPQLRPEPPIGGLALRQKVFAVPSHVAR